MSSPSTAERRGLPSKHSQTPHLPFCSQQVQWCGISLTANPGMLLYTPVLQERERPRKRKLEILQAPKMKCRRKVTKWRCVESQGWGSQPQVPGERRRGPCWEPVGRNCRALWPLMVFAAPRLKMMIKVIKLSGTKTDGELAAVSEGFPGLG